MAKSQNIFFKWAGLNRSDYYLTGHQTHKKATRSQQDKLFLRHPFMLKIKILIYPEQPPEELRPITTGPQWCLKANIFNLILLVIILLVIFTKVKILLSYKSIKFCFHASLRAGILGSNCHDFSNVPQQAFGFSGGDAVITTF